MSRVAGKVVVVTGAAGGQGAAEAELLAREGAHVVATDVDELDVSRPQDWLALRDRLASEHGRVDGLVNNAGITHRARLEEVALDDWNRVLAVNVTGALLGIQTLAPLMPPGSSIVNVGSLAGLNAHYPVAYTVSKWALRGLTRVASMELGPKGIRVNIVHPGYIETAMTASAPAAFREASVRSTPLGRTGLPDEVAAVVLFLVSDESSYVNGAEIPIDGGQAGHGGAKELSDAIVGAAA